MNAIIAAKMASIKQQQMEQQAAGDEEAAIESAPVSSGTAGAVAGAATQPAENLGGAEVHQEKNETQETRSHQQHGKEWDEYALLADRDMWDMQDEERLRLEELHKKYEYAKAKQAQ